MVRGMTYGNFSALMVSFVGTVEGLTGTVRKVFERLALLASLAHTIPQGASWCGESVNTLPADPRRRSPYQTCFFSPAVAGSAPFSGPLMQAERRQISCLSADAAARVPGYARPHVSSSTLARSADD
jgi:hypothetical protein